MIGICRNSWGHGRALVCGELTAIAKPTSARELADCWDGTSDGLEALAHKRREIIVFGHSRVRSQ